MSNYTSGSALELISLSEREDRIVTAEYSVGKAADLLADCDDYTEYDSSDSVIREYWGETWRVHLVELEHE